MGLADWLKFGRKTKEVQVKEVSKPVVAAEGQTALTTLNNSDGLPAGAGSTTLQTKVLMVQDGSYIPQLAEYALKMAGKLGCDIVALDVSDRPLQFTGERRTRESERFIELANANINKFHRQAQALAIKVEHVVKIGATDEIIAQLSAEDQGIRYVLTKPQEEVAVAGQSRAHVPVVDLYCSRLQSQPTAARPQARAL